MAMIKKTSSEAQAPVAEKAGSGTDAAIERLQKSVETAEKSFSKTSTAGAAPKYQTRDFDKEARGKTRCALWEAFLMSPFYAGDRIDGSDEFLKRGTEVVGFIMKQIFPED